MSEIHDLDDYYPPEDLAPHITGNPEEDWMTVAYVCANALQNFSPAEWVNDTGMDTAAYLKKQIEWHGTHLVRAVNFFYDVQEYYTKNTTEPF